MSPESRRSSARARIAVEALDHVGNVSVHVVGHGVAQRRAPARALDRPGAPMVRSVNRKAMSREPSVQRSSTTTVSSQNVTAPTRHPPSWAPAIMAGWHASFFPSHFRGPTRHRRFARSSFRQIIVWRDCRRPGGRVHLDRPMCPGRSTPPGPEPFPPPRPASGASAESAGRPRTPWPANNSATPHRP